MLISVFFPILISQLIFISLSRFLSLSLSLTISVICLSILVHIRDRSFLLFLQKKKSATFWRTQWRGSRLIHCNPSLSNPPVLIHLIHLISPIHNSSSSRITSGAQLVGGGAGGRAPLLHFIYFGQGHVSI